MAFIAVYSKTTSRQQRIPEHWWGHSVLGRDFRKTPPPESEETQNRGTRGSATAGSASHSTADHKEKK